LKKLAIISSHPIQYNAPLFALLDERAKLQVKVFYTWGETVLKDKFDPGFGKNISWDIPVLDGYDYEFLENTSADKGSHHFKGIINPNNIISLKKFQPDALLVYGWSFHSHLQIMRYFKGKIPVLFRGDSTLLDKAGFLHQIKRNIFLRWVYRFVDMAIYTGKSNKLYFYNAGLSDKQLVFGPHAIDNQRYSCKQQECREQALQFREHWGISLSAKVILFAGKFEAKKNPLLLIEAFKDVVSKQDLHLIMVGNGELEGCIKIEAQSSKNIHFMSFQNQSVMPALYAASDLFVLPSQGPGETWGLAINEAMASGKAVIVSDRCGCAADLVKDGVNGFVFTSGNKQQLTASIEKVFHTEEKPAKMGKQSFEIIKEYSLESLALSIENTVIKVKYSANA
jgi:glycosyltransferase involved in cell wall biosynthesis